MKTVTYVGKGHELVHDEVTLEYGVPTEVNEKLAKTLLETMPDKVLVEGYNTLPDDGEVESTEEPIEEGDEA